jgi:hypothetical protein
MSSKRLLVLAIPFILALAPFLIAGCVGIPDLTPQMSHQGRLLDSAGEPVADGNYTFRYRIFHSLSGGAPVYTETKTVAVDNGLFDTALGLTGVITPDIFAEPSWLEITVNGETLAPRQKLLGAPYAFSLAAGAVVQGNTPITRTFEGVVDTGAAMTVWNDNATAGGGNGLLVVNQASPDHVDLGEEGVPVAALKAIAAGGQITTPPYTGSYGGIFQSQSYRGLYARGATDLTDNDPRYAAAVFDSHYGIVLINGGVCFGCTVAYFAQNAGADAIQPGDFVAALGVTVHPELNVPVMQVQKVSAPDDAVVGVAAGALIYSPVYEVQGVKTGGFDGRSGDAAPGEYLSVGVEGLVQANLDGLEAQVGDYLSFPDGTPAIAAAEAQQGVARVMSAPDGTGKVWVLLGGK